MASEIVLSPNSGRDRSYIFDFRNPVKVDAFNLPGGETVAFEEVLREDQQVISKSGDCCFVVKGDVVDIATKPYQIGCCTPIIEGGVNSSLVMDTPGQYRAILSAGAVGIATVKVTDIDWDIDITQELRGCPCEEEVVCVDTTWHATGQTRCVDHIIEQQEESNCGNKRWIPTTDTCGYCASEKIETCDGLVGWGYIPGDADADPLAIVAMDYCDGNQVMIFPSRTSKHSIEIKDCDGTVIGYAANQSCCDACQ